MSRFASGVGLIPEQNWELPDLAASPFGTDPTLASIGFVERRRGRLGVAADVVGGVVRAAGGRVSPPAATSSCRVRRTRATSPHAGDDAADGHEPRRQLVGDGLAGDRHRHDRAREHRLRRGDEHRRQLGDDDRLGRPRASGSFSVAVPVTGGRTSSTSSRSAATGGTAHAKRTVVFDFVPGTLLLDVRDPDGDDNGPGNYAYPTSADFQPGAFDIQRFQVYDAGADVTFRLQTRDLSETFGSPLGAQLVDVYVHVPGAASTSTAAPTRCATSRSRRRSRGAA